jgi:3-deoxy-7-phosphoheptulonate synthase
VLIVLKPDATPEQQREVEAQIRSLGFHPHAIPGAVRTAIGITGNKGSVDPEPFRMMPGVADAIAVSQPFKLVSREVKPDDTTFKVNGVPVGGKELVIIAGPCSVESEEQILSAAAAVKAAGAKMLRGGAFKPRTSPYEFQGLKGEGLRLLAKARAETGLAVVTECKDTETLAMVADVADIIQIGARNMQTTRCSRRRASCASRSCSSAG